MATEDLCQMESEERGGICQITPLNSSITPLNSSIASTVTKDSIIPTKKTLLPDKDDVATNASTIIENCLKINQDPILSNTNSEINTETNTLLNNSISTPINDPNDIDVTTYDENKDPALKLMKTKKTTLKRKSTGNVRDGSGKKEKKGLRADCPTYCKAGCKYTHHKLLIDARRMFENDSKTTLVFLDIVYEYYNNPDEKINEAEPIFDPSKNTSFPLLHYIALMGKCSGSFALADSGHVPTEMLTENNDNVLHTMVREMYNFNCTHGHMDILYKKFNLLLREFSACLCMQNKDLKTCMHVCASLIATNSSLLTSRKPPFRYYQFSKNMFQSLLDQFIADDHPKSKLNMVDNEGNTLAHYLARDRASIELLDMLKTHDIDVTIANNNNETVETISEQAPQLPPAEMLELAVFSNKSNKYKASVDKKPKYSPVKKPIQSSPATKQQFSPAFNNNDGSSPQPSQRDPGKRKIKKKDFGTEFISPGEDDIKRAKLLSTLLLDHPIKSESRTPEKLLLPPENDSSIIKIPSPTKVVLPKNFPTSPRISLATNVSIPVSISKQSNDTLAPEKITLDSFKSDKVVSPKRDLGLSPAAKILQKLNIPKEKIKLNLVTPTSLKIIKPPVKTVTVPVSKPIAIAPNIPGLNGCPQTKTKNPIQPSPLLQRIKPKVVTSTDWKPKPYVEKRQKNSKLDTFQPSMVSLVKTERVSPTSTCQNPVSPLITNVQSLPLISNVQSLPLISNVQSLKPNVNKTVFSSPSFVPLPMNTSNRPPVLPKTGTAIRNTTLSAPDMSFTKQLLNPSAAASHNAQYLVRAPNGKMMSVNVHENPNQPPTSNQNSQPMQPPYQFRPPYTQAPMQYQMQSHIFVAPNGVRYMVPGQHPMQRPYYRQMSPQAMQNLNQNFMYPPNVTVNGPGNLRNKFMSPQQPMVSPTGQQPNNINPYQMPVIPGLPASFPLPNNQQMIPNNQKQYSEALKQMSTNHNNPPNNNTSAPSNVNKNPKKSRNLEDRINQIIKQTASNDDTVRSKATDALNRLASKIDERAPPVIILDSDNDNFSDSTNSQQSDNSQTVESPLTMAISAKKVQYTISDIEKDKLTNMKRLISNNNKELQCPAVESTNQGIEDLGTAKMASLMKNYIQQQGSMQDFIKFSQAKRDQFSTQISNDRQEIISTNEDILKMENFVVNAQGSISTKEREIRSLKTQIKSSQDQSKKLRLKRSDLIHRVTDFEQRLKRLEAESNRVDLTNTT